MKLIELLSVINFEVHSKIEIVKFILLHQKKIKMRYKRAIDPNTIATYSKDLSFVQVILPEDELSVGV